MMDLIKPATVRRIPPGTDPDELAGDLDVLKDKARAAGACQVAFIHPREIVFIAGNPEDRLPLAHKSAHWPLSYPKDDIRGALGAYEAALFFKVEARDLIREYSMGPITNTNHRKIYRKSYEVATAVESAAFYQGHHLAFGLASGNCRSVFCQDAKRCWAMVKGRVCVHPYKARPCLTAVGIDIEKTMKKAGMKSGPDEEGPFVGGLVVIA